MYWISAFCSIRMVIFMPECEWKPSCALPIIYSFGFKFTFIHRYGLSSRFWSQPQLQGILLMVCMRLWVNNSLNFWCKIPEIKPDFCGISGKFVYFAFRSHLSHGQSLMPCRSWHSISWAPLSLQELHEGCVIAKLWQGRPCPVDIW